MRLRVRPDGLVLPLPKCIRQPVKAVPPHPQRFVATWDRQQLRHVWQIMVKSRMETCHLGKIRKSAMKRLGQQDLLRHMVRIEWTELERNSATISAVIRCGL